MCNIGIYCTLGREYFPRPPASGNIPTLGTIYTDIPLGRVEYLVYISREISIEHPSMGLASLAQLHILYYTLHTENAYCLSYRFLNNVVITSFIEMVESVEMLDGRLSKRSVERVRYEINNLLHFVIVKYGDISLVLCISTRLRLVTILSLLVKYLVILHADPCNKSYISREISIKHPSVGLASLELG